MSDIIQAPFPYFGGKATPRIRNAILKLLPPHQAYCEPFGGAASILLAKQPAKIETYNDIDDGLFGFFKVLANPVLFHHMQLRLSMLPVSRQLWREAREKWRDETDPVTRATLWYIVQRQSFGGMGENAWGSVVGSSSRGKAQTVSSWQHAVDNLWRVHQRLRDVQIEHSDFRKILQRYRGPGYLAYVDPPYAPDSRKAGEYKNELTADDHRDLVRLLLDYDGAVVLSGYNTPLYQPLDAAGWIRHEIQVVCSASGRTAKNGLKGAGNVLAKQSRTECIWLNPEAQKRKKKG